ncbi:MAG: L,D-transpeptidase family protein [Wenzhouxiangella sp.]|nr:L,D-transpeptidase family protein [Wenzhouxiangella sp.]MCH8476927.1 L,D-transpeptidase family protein [Wenzhouxiangella sp.]
MPSRRLILLPALCLLLSLVHFCADARTWPIEADTEVIGELELDFARRSDTLMDIARWVSMGHFELRRANPEVDLWQPGEGTRVLVPSLFVLPEGPRDGIVINRAEKRLYFFHNDPETGQRQVTTYPIGIGKQGRETPLGSARVVTKLDNPAWYPTQGVIDDYASRGEVLPRRVPPGPDNPLGDHAIVLDLPGYLLHGTNRPDGVGMRVSQGCVRLYPEHIRDLVAAVPLGTSVHFIDQPIKVGQRDGNIYLKVLPDAEGDMPRREMVLDAVNEWFRNRGPGAEKHLDAAIIDQLLQSADGITRVIGRLDSID